MSRLRDIYRRTERAKEKAGKLFAPEQESGLETIRTVFNCREAAILIPAMRRLHFDEEFIMEFTGKYCLDEEAAPCE